MSWPDTSILPELGLSRAPSNDSRVLLPLPLGPTIEAKVPSPTSNETSSTALTRLSPDLKDLDRFFTCSILFGPHHFRRPDFSYEPSRHAAADNSDNQRCA